MHEKYETYDTNFKDNSQIIPLTFINPLYKNAYDYCH